jgi:type I restriction enzyme M protein
MDHSVHNKLVSFIWSIADDCLRDVYVRGKYRDVILPMVVLRRLDTLLSRPKMQYSKKYATNKSKWNLPSLMMSH